MTTVQQELTSELMRKKAISVEIKDADEGIITAVFSRFNVVDHDGDVTLPGAFKDGAEVLISAYQHGSWMGALPVGKGVIHSDDEKATMEGQFFMDTAHGADTFRTMKGTAGLQEWSYGFDIKATGDVEDLPEELRNGAQRVLKELDVYEVSPVLRGAGVNTETTDVKALDADLAIVNAAILKELARFERTRVRLILGA